MTHDAQPLPSSTMPGRPRNAENRWIVFRRPSARARVRLLCFHHAGGNALVYRRWVTELPDWIDVCPVQLPGRGQRIEEPLLTRMHDVVNAFVAETDSLLYDLPLALFGHSMGAAVAFAVAERLGPSVAHVFAAARRSPSQQQKLHTLDDSGLERYLCRLGATPASVFDYPELRDHVLAVLRADLTLNDAYLADRPLPATPLTVLGGSQDLQVPPETLEAWRELTPGPFRRVMFPADHFFTASCRDAVQRLVVESLEVLA
jgi:surfactin synthase thioesterase subunit